MTEEIKNYFKVSKLNNTLGHAFMISNTCLNDIKDELESILSEYFFQKKIDLVSNPDIIIVSPDNDKITKDQVIDLKNKLLNYSLSNNVRIYIIDGIEKMNSYATNSILKFLEEPEENIYAFLISNNSELVYDTIKSRCQNFHTNGNELKNNEIPIEMQKMAYEFIIMLNEKKKNTFPYIYDIINKKEEKEKINILIDSMEKIYQEILNKFIYKKEFSFEVLIADKLKKYEKLSKESIIKNIIKLNNIKKKMKSNLNVGLLIDKIIIELGE